MTLVLERRYQEDATLTAGPVWIAPVDIGDGYWEYRVKLTDTQAVIGFPKFGTIGIGFVVEDDWNSNLPWGCFTESIFDHIKHNKGDDAISDEDALAAIKLIQDAVDEDHPELHAGRDRLRARGSA